MTNFYQEAEKLVLKGLDVKQLYAGQSGLLKMTHAAEPNDGLFVVCEGGTPFFLTPCGIASVVAGTVSSSASSGSSPKKPPSLRSNRTSSLRLFILSPSSEFPLERENSVLGLPPDLRPPSNLLA